MEEGTYNAVYSQKLVSAHPQNQSTGHATHLITITPEVVLGSDVLVWVLRSLLQGRLMSPMLPMLIPQDIGIDGGNNQAGPSDATIGQHSSNNIPSHNCSVHVRYTMPFSPVFYSSKGSLLDGELAPEIYISISKCPCFQLSSGLRTT